MNLSLMSELRILNLSGNGFIAIESFQLTNGDKISFETECYYSATTKMKMWMGLLFWNCITISNQSNYQRITSKKIYLQ